MKLVVNCSSKHYIKSVVFLGGAISNKKTEHMQINKSISNTPRQQCMNPEIKRAFHRSIAYILKTNMDLSRYSLQVFLLLGNQ